MRTKKEWTKTVCDDCGKAAVTHSHDGIQEYAHCAEHYLAFHKRHADETRVIVRKIMDDAYAAR
jgi:hypothetical protein